MRGPKHVVTKGATPVLSPAETRKLLGTIDTGTLAGLRDRALLSVMLYSFAPVSAVLGMRRQDYFGQGSRGWLRQPRPGRLASRPALLHLFAVAPAGVVETETLQLLISMWMLEASREDIILAWLEEAYTLQELVRAIHRAKAQDDNPRLNAYLNSLAER